jgi:uncharacterized protein YegP (UPF0339 family)
MPTTFELYQDSGKEWRWRLRHDNGRVIAESDEGYVAKADSKAGIEAVKAATRASVVEQ